MSKPVQYKFRLYVAGNSANSLQATMNFRVFCAEHLPELHQIEIIDVLLEPKRALEEGVFLTPTLVKLAPQPVLKIIGTLKESSDLLKSLQLYPRSKA
jgi:circadian clock protein KaiB